MLHIYNIDLLLGLNLRSLRFSRDDIGDSSPLLNLWYKRDDNTEIPPLRSE